jgi:hypothetical protein
MGFRFESSLGYVAENISHKSEILEFEIIIFSNFENSFRSFLIGFIEVDAKCSPNEERRGCVYTLKLIL